MAQVRQDLTARRRNVRVESSLPAEYLAGETAHLHYDYAQVDAAHRDQVQAAAVDIRRRQLRAAADLLAIGNMFLEVKDLLPHGQFREWVEIEFGYRYQAAAEEMNIARVYGKNPIIGHLPPTALRLLAAPSTPAEVRWEFEHRAEVETVKVKDVRQAIKEHRQAAATGKPYRPTATQPPAPAKPAPTDIDAEYRLVEPEAEGSRPEAMPTTFADWFKAMPEPTELRDYLSILQMAQVIARRVREAEPRLRFKVEDVLPPWAQLVNAVENRIRELR